MQGASHPTGFAVSVTRLGALAGCMAGLALWPTAGAAQWFVQPTIKAGLTATSNSGYTRSTTAQSDTIVDVEPGIIVRGKGPRITVDGALYVVALDYLNGTQSNTVLPHGNLGMTADLIDRYLMLDASVVVDQTSANAFGVRPEGTSSVNVDTNTQYRFNPYVKHAFNDNLELNARADNTWVRTSHSTSASNATPQPNPRDNAYVQDQRISLVRKPTPLGAELNVRHQDTRYAQQNVSALTIDQWRAIGTLGLNESVQVGVVGGSEKNRVPGAEVTDQVYGLKLRWRPDERTDLDTTVEHRFFGAGYEAAFTHRTPFLAWNLRLSRGATTSASTLASSQAGGNIANLLDATFTTRHPDPVERARVVREFMATRGLSASATGPVDIYTQLAQLEQALNASVVWTTPRDTASASFYLVKNDPLPLIGAADTGQLAPATSQKGVVLQFNHRLTPLVSLDTQARWSRVEGRGSIVTSHTRESVYRAGLNWLLSPRTTGNAGLRWQQIKSSVTGDADETALYMSLDHRF